MRPSRASGAARTPSGSSTPSSRTKTVALIGVEPGGEGLQGHPRRRSTPASRGSSTASARWSCPTTMDRSWRRSRDLGVVLDYPGVGPSTPPQGDRPRFLRGHRRGSTRGFQPALAGTEGKGARDVPRGRPRDQGGENDEPANIEARLINLSGRGDKDIDEVRRILANAGAERRRRERRESDRRPLRETCGTAAGRRSCPWSRPATRSRNDGTSDPGDGGRRRGRDRDRCAVLRTTAEGPTIHRSSSRAASESGTSLRAILMMVDRIRAHGAAARADGLRKPGPRDGRGQLHEVLPGRRCRRDHHPRPDTRRWKALPRSLPRAGVHPVLLAAPTTRPERLDMLVQETRGFLYYVSLQGVTGARSDLAKGIEEKVQAPRRSGTCRSASASGSARPSRRRPSGRMWTASVIGSAIVDLIEQANGRTAAIDAVGRYIADVKAALA